MKLIKFKFIFFLFISYLLLTTFSIPVFADPCFPSCAIEPSCCAEILNRLHRLGDITNLPDDQQPYHGCPWNESDANTNYRAFCRPSTCNQLPEGLNYRGRCGWYWSFHDGYTSRPGGYGCMVGASANSMTPICGGGSNPTQPPQPTNPPPTSIPPTSIPTPTKVIIPTYSAQPTNSPTRPPLINPTQTPQRPTASPNLQPTNTELPISIGVGIFQASIKDSIANVKISIIKTAVASKKVLDLPSYAGKKILSLDQRLEMFMNGLFEQIKMKILYRETKI